MSDILSRIQNEAIAGPADLAVEAVKHGYQLTESMQWWAVTNPEPYKSIVKSWIESGSELISTNTAAANRLRLMKFGLEDKTPEINRQLINLTKERYHIIVYIITPRFSTR